MDRAEKFEDLKTGIAAKERVLVAYSGGVDSSLLAAVAHDALRGDALAVILDCDTMPRRELEHAKELAELLGLNYRVAEFPIMKEEQFCGNPANRCYICKKRSAAILKSIARAEGISCIADGVNLSDYNDYRPGIAACDEEGIWHPFVDAAITKEDIRILAKGLGLPVWNKPSAACLASRIPYGQPITQGSLRMVDEAEQYLMSLGFLTHRVRCHGRLARIELLVQDMARAMVCRDEIARKFKAIGFDYVALDMEGFRSGSMDESLMKDGPAKEALWTSGR
ncbi:MAG TPA: ATP-dependent sacrificial sulfur transferase LarE [Methanothrix sp.]|nr:ATP-dependent sacrificial sulfur transferase LarE [Methanothrix sp.]